MNWPQCTYSRIAHPPRDAVYRRLPPDGISMYYCEECRQALPPEPYNLKHPPERIAQQERLL